MIAMIAAGCGLNTRPRTLSANLTYRGTNSSRGPISAISAINFLMSKLPKELKSFATKSRAGGDFEGCIIVSDRMVQLTGRQIRKSAAV